MCGVPGMAVGGLCLHLGGEAQILQLLHGGLEAVLAAVDGDALALQTDGELQLSLGQGVGDALDAVLAHHVGYVDGSHIRFLL